MAHQGSIATHIPHSLPSFAQTFSSSSLDRISPMKNTLPPIQTRPILNDTGRSKSPTPTTTLRTSEEATTPRASGRKRAHTEISKSSLNDDRSEPRPNSPSIKEEPEHDMLEPSPPPSTVPLARPPKKRRVTVSGGAPQLGPLNTDVRVPPDQTNSTPISPVLIGFTVQRDNASAVEQVRSMISVKQKQKALIEQRRGSLSTMSPVGPPPATMFEERAGSQKSTPPTRTRRSPNAATVSRRPPPLQRPPSPPPPNNQGSAVSGHPTAPLPHHSLPPPPISFARRRANQLGGSGKRKPADIVISPREAHTQEQFAPSIQSAPPIPQGGSQGYPGRFQMSLPRLPSLIGHGDSGRKLLGGNVPPTPTRLATLRGPGAPGHTVQPISGIGRSPPNASVAIASSLVPPTPSSLQHPGYSGDRAAFLAPFELFYDALNDSKQLKSWLSDQLHRSNALMQSLTQQQEKMNEVIDGLVEKRTAGLRMEVGALHRRVEELEDALRFASGGGNRRPSTHSMDGYNNMKTKGKQPARNGLPDASYTFPALDRDRLRPDPDRQERYPSPGRSRDLYREREGHPSAPEHDHEIPYVSRRLSTSASRLDLSPRPQRQDSEGPPALSKVYSPPTSLRDTLPPPGKTPRGSSALSRSPRLSTTSGERDREMTGTPPLARDRRENGNAMDVSPPERPHHKEDREG